MVTVINDQIILEEEYDENYKPTEAGTCMHSIFIIYHNDEITILY